ncbi:GNAT family N-acetyltransferase [Chloroflexota bacterium]
MVSEEIEYKFITINSPYYFATVTLRHDVFYRPSGAQIDAVTDIKEGKSKHLVAIVDDQVVGYIRITVEGKTAQLSQFVVAPQMQGKANIAKNLYTRASSEAKKLGAKKISGEIRLPMANVASRLGYDVSENVFASPKTGIPHKRVEKDL